MTSTTQRSSATVLLLFAVTTGVVVYTLNSLNAAAKKRKPISKKATFGAGKKQPQSSQLQLLICNSLHMCVFCVFALSPC